MNKILINIIKITAATTLSIAISAIGVLIVKGIVHILTHH